MGYLAELFRFPGWATADELLVLHQRLAGSSGGESERTELLELVGLTDARSRRIETMSKGMQQRLGIAQALVGTPRFLFLDEPTSALDPGGRRTVRGLLEELRRRGVAVLLNSHLLSEIELVCDRVAILSRGSIVAEGRPVRAREAARRRGGRRRRNAALRRCHAGARVPKIVADLVAAGEHVYGVRILETTLEEIYLEAVGDQTGMRGIPDRDRLRAQGESAPPRVPRRARPDRSLPRPLRAGHERGVRRGRGAGPRRAGRRPASRWTNAS